MVRLHVCASVSVSPSEMYWLYCPYTLYLRVSSVAVCCLYCVNKVYGFIEQCQALLVHPSIPI